MVPPALPWSPENVANTARQYMENPDVRAAGTSAAGAALIVDGAVGIGGKRGGIGGALGTILFGVVWLIFSTFLMGAFTGGNDVGPGEIKGTAIVRDVDWIDSSSGSRRSTNKTCRPVAELTVDGTSYTATTGYSAAPCEWTPGQTVTVIYHPAHVQETARVVASGGVMIMAFLFPALGAVMIVAGVGAFMLRAGSIAAGIVLIRQGLKARRMPARTWR
jgi:hypothetical protein